MKREGFEARNNSWSLQRRALERHGLGHEAFV